MFHNQRLIWGTTELSEELNDFRVGTANFAYAASGYLYIGQERPFNNLWFEVATANTSGATLTAEIWYANDWQDAVDLNDGSASGGVPLARSGRISWNTAWNSDWDNADRCSRVTGLESFEIYDLYWMRLSWSGSLAAATVLSYIGQKFCAETDLVGQYADLRQTALKTAFAGGGTKTTWDDEIFAATDAILDDLKTRRLIDSSGQVLDWSIFKMPAVHKAAELIYHGLGSQFNAAEEKARKAYAESMKKDKFRIDKDKDGKLSIKEKGDSIIYMER